MKVENSYLAVIVIAVGICLCGCTQLQDVPVPPQRQTAAVQPGPETAPASATTAEPPRAVPPAAETGVVETPAAPGGKPLPPQEDVYKAFKETYARNGKPKVGIIITSYDTVGTTSRSRMQDYEAIHNAVTKIFKDAEARVVDLRLAEEKFLDDAAKRRDDGGIALQTRNVAGLIVLVDVSSTTEGKYELRSNGKLLRTTDSSIVGTARTDAERPLTREKIDSLAKSISKQLMDGYTSEPVVTQVTLVARGLVSQETLSTIIKFIEGLTGVKAVEQQSYSEGVGEVYVEYLGSTRELYDAISENTRDLPGFRLSGVDVDANNIELKSVDR